MRSRQILLAAGLTIAVFFAALLVWEFLIEGPLRTALFPGIPVETASERWMFLEISLGAGVAATIVPVWLAFRLAAKHAAAARELEVAEERVKVIAANPDWLWEMDENGVYTYASPKVRELLGYAPEEVIGRTPFDLMPPDEAVRVAADFAAVMTERRPFSLLENVNLHKDGYRVTLETSGIPLFDKNGTFKGYRGVDRDVTQRKAIERRLADQNALLEAVFEAIPDAIGTANLERKLVAVNRGFTDVFGYTQEEVEGRRTAMLYESEEEFRRQGEIRYNPTAEASAHPYVVRYRRKDGQVFPAEVRGGPILDAAGTRIGYLAITRDITDRQALENRLREARKMEAIGQLTAGIAHDFNNMLQIVQGNLDLVSHLTGSDGRVRPLLANALEASRRGARLTQQLLSFARRDILLPQVVDVARLIEDRLGLLREALGDGITVVTDLSLDLPPTAVDPHTLETALLNVVTNARTAMPDGGTLTIRTAARQLARDLAVEDGSLPAGTYVEITLADTGCGMSEAVRDRAFEPFFTTRPVGEGGGLGLSVVQGFARQSGGHAALESTVGHGTTVTLLLPTVAD